MLMMYEFVFKLDEEEKLSEIESDDAIEDDESNAKTSTKIKKTTKKQTKRSRGPERRSKKMYGIFNYDFIPNYIYYYFIFQRN